MINYIVACWMGERRQNSTDPLTYIKNHLHWLKTAKNIDNVIFVFNGKNHPQQEKAIDLVYRAGHKYFIRPNNGFSYGAWEYALKEVIKEDKYNYSFLIEDDYIPSTPYLIKYFLDNIKPNVGFVSSFYDYDKSNPHAGISNGLICHKSIRKLIRRRQNIFELYSPLDNYFWGDGGKASKDNKTMYGGAVSCQKTFLQPMVKEGYDIEDITIDNYTKFYSAVGSQVGIHLYGNKEGICLLQPNFEHFNATQYYDVNYKIKRSKSLKTKRI